MVLDGYIVALLVSFIVIFYFNATKTGRNYEFMMFVGLLLIFTFFEAYLRSDYPGGYGGIRFPIIEIVGNEDIGPSWLKVVNSAISLLRFVVNGLLVWMMLESSSRDELNSKDILRVSLAALLSMHYINETMPDIVDRISSALPVFGQALIEIIVMGLFITITALACYVGGKRRVS